MANTKISALTSAATIVGTEVLPIVQSSATVKVAISNLNPGLSTILATKGGTGQTSYAVGDLLYADTTTTLAKLPDVATGSVLISGGVSTAPSWGKVSQTALSTNVVGNGPTFRAYSDNSQSINSGATTKIQFNKVSFDTNSNFDNTTNYRFTPTVAGYYQVNLAVGFAAMSAGEIILQINKNGSTYQFGVDVVGVTVYITNMSTLVYMNGSTDYIEGYVYQASGLARALAAATTQCTFSGTLVRSA